ncbi:hypothetical protein Lalb_Chr04g0255571 [Lupinus albus]|uniref:Uncharacterized protein n=1 Tax=Lupinus albus TaxID=3870 RepID=A0A6A4QN77_LUPAL|nr:hypothetical protein Lalb_Chr04g0255571 [Lupinus albus]
MRMLAVAPEMITDECYLEQTVKYAIYCGVIDQKILAQKRGVLHMKMQRK